MYALEFRKKSALKTAFEQANSDLIMAFSNVILISFLPETRNKSIAELDQIFRAKTASWKRQFSERKF